MIPAEKARILTVDDEPHIRDLVARILTAEGYYSTTAPDAEVAIKKLETDSFDVVVSDIMMPGMSGLELLSYITRNHPNIAVVMVTAVDDRQTGVRAVELGAYGYIIKPFRRNEILITVVSAIERKQMETSGSEYERNVMEQITRGTAELRQHAEMELRMISTSGHRHGETAAHIQRIALYAAAVINALPLGWSLQQMDDLKLAAAMHDVGIMGIPDTILMKPGKLTPHELRIMREHTNIGARILEGFDSKLLVMTRDVVLSHHEKWDGTGYPQGLAKESIPESARIVAVCDVYDALVHNRMRRKAFSEEDALSLMSSARGKHFDPKVLECFFHILPEIRRIRNKLRDPSPSTGRSRQLGSSREGA